MKERPYLNRIILYYLKNQTPLKYRRCEMNTDKKELKILVINRAWKEGEKPVPIFKKYRAEGYDVIIFPFTEDKRRTEVIFFDLHKHLLPFEELFNINIEYDMDGGDPFYDFDLAEISEEVFYDILDQEFEVSSFSLTDIER